MTASCVKLNSTLRKRGRDYLGEMLDIGRTAPEIDGSDMQSHYAQRGLRTLGVFRLEFLENLGTVLTVSH